MTLEERLAQLEAELKDLRAEKEKSARNLEWRDRHDRFRDELKMDDARYTHNIREGMNKLIRGTLDCSSMYALTDEGKRLAVAMMDELKPIVWKYYQPQNNPSICHPCRSYE